MFYMNKILKIPPHPPLEKGGTMATLKAWIFQESPPFLKGDGRGIYI
jgi:hypothetical protein